MIKVTAETLEKALIFAINAHKGQVRKGNGRPYILHPISVMARIFDNKKSENMYLLACAAVLHDCVEDTDVTINDIKLEFGEDISAIVDELTLDKEKYATIGKKEYLAKEVNSMSPYALAIKLCDRLDNVCDMKDMSDSFRSNYVPETWYILNKLDRDLTPSHKNLIEQIKAELGKYEKYNVPSVEVIKNKIGKLEVYENGKLTGSQG